MDETIFTARDVASADLDAAYARYLADLRRNDPLGIPMSTADFERYSLGSRWLNGLKDMAHKLVQTCRLMVGVHDYEYYLRAHAATPSGSYADEPGSLLPLLLGGPLPQCRQERQPLPLLKSRSGIRGGTRYFRAPPAARPRLLHAADLARVGFHHDPVASLFFGFIERRVGAG